jgi:hypothetical protein
MMLSRENGMGNGERATLGGNLRTGQVLESATRLFTEKDTTRAPGEGVPEPVKNKGQS